MDLTQLTGSNTWTDTPGLTGAYSSWRDRMSDLLSGRLKDAPLPGDFPAQDSRYILDRILMDSLEKQRRYKQTMNLNELIQMMHQGTVARDPRFDGVYGRWM